MLGQYDALVKVLDVDPETEEEKIQYHSVFGDKGVEGDTRDKALENCSSRT